MERVLLWCFMLKDYVPNISYIKGTANDAVYDLTSILIMNYGSIESIITRDNLDERYCVDKLNGNTLPLT